MSRVVDAYDTIGLARSMIDLCSYATSDLSLEHAAAFGIALGYVGDKLDEAKRILNEQIDEAKAGRPA